MVSLIAPAVLTDLHGKQ